MSELYRGRFAPSPTGPLHFGSLIAAVASYSSALSNSGEWYVRIDDIDPPREVSGATEEIVASLDAHGFFNRSNGAGELEHVSHKYSTPTTTVVLQSQRQSSYETTLQQLAKQDLLFACQCTRKQLGGSIRYPGTCETLGLDTPDNALRCRLPDHEFIFTDRVCGRFSQHVLAEIGCPVVKRRDGLWSYLLANVVDDAVDSVSEVVRGADLLDNTPRQLALIETLGLALPSYCHVPVALNSDGEKLSKQSHAKPLQTNSALDNLCRAWLFLGQTRYCGNSISGFWTHAESHWDAKRIETDPGQNQTAN